jgi:exonuclease SbcC
MIPIRLKLQGLYSYQIEQEIDFTKLTEPQLFGIFGPVGAGKSAILEAIMLALYGELERLGKKDNYYLNALNSKCKKIEVELEFLAGRGNLRHFKFTHTYDASRKNPVTNKNRLEKIDGEWVTCSETTEEILGLKLENFRRTVIIPQGKFQEFLSLPPKERTAMLQEIFNLQKYDLSEKTKRLLNKTENDIEVRKREVERLQSITPEDVESLRKREEEKRQAHEKLKKMLEEMNQTLQEMARLKSVYRQIQEQKKLEAELLKKENEIAELEKSVREKEACQKKFGGQIEKLDMITADLQRLNSELQTVKESERQKSEAQAELQAQYAAYKQQYEQRDKVMAQIEDLQKVQKINELSGKIFETTAVLDQLQKAQQDLNAKLNECATKLEELRKQEKQLRKQIENHPVLIEIKNWFAVKQQIETKKSELNREIAEHRKEIAEIESEFLREANSEVWQQIFSKQFQTADFETAIQLLDSTLTALNSRQLNLQKDIEKLRVQERLVAFAQELKPGEPCPLCGALEHPNPLTGDHHSEILLQHEQERQECLNQIDRIQEKKQAWLRLADRQKAAVKLLHKTEEQLAACESELQQHLAQFKWDDFSADNPTAIDNALTAVAAAKAELQQREAEIEKLENAQKQCQQEQEASRENLAKTQQQHTALQSELKTLAGSLKNLDAAQYARVPEGQILHEIESLQQQQALLEKQYRESERTLNELTNELSGLRGQISTLTTQIKQKQTELEQLQTKITAAVKAAGYTGLPAVMDILHSSLDVDKAKGEIETYRNRLREVQSALKQLNAQMDGKQFDEAEMEQLVQKRDETARTEDLCRSELAQLTADIKSAEQNTARIKELTAELAALDKRFQNLKLLDKMFKGSGFVKYVSMHFLNQICALANKRFKELTDHQLALETDENGFVVRDFLHEGKKRNIKTLSGGQTFQAALCLALALSDLVHSTSNATQNLFFLDEGFGSLDNDSLTKVFDTLKTLRNQHRILGVISHVDSMQQEIDVFLKIHKDPVRGSIITPSWEMD